MWKFSVSSKLAKQFVNSFRFLSVKRGKLEMTSLKGNPIFEALQTDADFRCLRDLFDRHEFPLRLAGGPVRDILSGKTPTDLDFATTATPEQMKNMFAKEGVRVINELGEKHGTITARINDRVNYEVTTLRIDKVTDGRHAEVEFTTDWQIDANRRDLTINSMFLDLEGNLYDYFKGRDDLAKKRIAFVGDAVERIQEDYLRILRYFRFYGRIADQPDNHEEETINAIRENAKGLDQISGERIWTELRKILAGNFSGEIMLKMIEVGLCPHIGLPENPNTKEFETVYKRMLDLKTELRPMTLIAALLRSEDELWKLQSRLKMSGFERDLGLFVIANREDKIHPEKVKPYQYLILDTKNKVADCKIFVEETLKYRGDLDLAKQISEWEIPRCPVNGHDLVAEGCEKGKVMTVMLNKLKTIWKESNYKISREELLTHIPRLLDDPAVNKLIVQEFKRKEKKNKRNK